MQIFFPGARKEEFSLPVLVFRRILPFGGYGPKTSVLFLLKEMFCSKFFYIILVTVYISEKELKL